MIKVTIDINYILTERSREYYCEGYRWLDLVCMQEWMELSGNYMVSASIYGGYTPVTVT